ncbi:SH2 domain-containing adapter protein D [Eublepharis macularius]|uniref:SH2 domain-containing adapter protein D n=1 Tax=Eublepharis macularius TaxID=481883 RepID=A0AA97JFT9_EUBMA|nr:SH2 domain-containing adapter protein D [Eublepharis macularius]
MAKWLKDYLSFGSRRSPPQPPKPDYTESEILKAYRAQKSLDFEDPYEDVDSKPEPDPGGSPNKVSAASSNLEGKYGSPKHRLIKVDSSDLNKSKVLLATAAEDPPGESEYSDPFDAHREPKEDGEEDMGLENNGYMEPYDAQKVVAALPGLGLQLYDTPYEEKELDADLEGSSAEKPRESRLPQDDERPADEYDQPWEWKKNHISRAFAVQFENPEWERTSSISSSSMAHMERCPEGSPPAAERVDPSLPLEKQAWFHGTISRADAEALLTLCKEGSYLVRNSETSRSDYSLSLRSSQGFMHMKFTRTKDSKYILGQNSAPFDSVPEVIHHYTAQELPVKGAEHLSLLYPVAVQTL